MGDHQGRDARGRWLPGFVPNPKGRGSLLSPSERLAYWLKQGLEVIRDVDVSTLTAVDALAIATIRGALTPEGQSDRHYVYDRLDGKPRQSTEITGAAGGPLELKWSDGSEA